MSKPGRTRRPKIQYEEYIDRGSPSPAEDAPSAPDYLHHHVSYTTTGDRVAIAQSQYATPASPQKNPLKRVHQDAHATSRDSQPPFEGDDAEDPPLPFDFMDPNYVFELEDGSDEPARRNRGKGVCASFSQLFITL